MPQASFRSLHYISCLACTVAFGCGGAAQAQAQAPKPTAPAAGADSTKATASADAKEQPASAAASRPKELPPEAPPDAVVTRSVADRVFSPRIAYMVNYPNSGVKDLADHKCSVKFPEPGNAKAACMDKERDKFTADVLVFEKSDEGTWLTIYKRSGNALAQMSKSRLGLGEDTPQRLVVKIESEKGWRPLFAGKKEFSVNLHDEYSVELDDPQYGRLVYDARIGLID
ncbi:MAG TPA: hypothetical protein VHC69_32535 [Polyangiaceae bacterium]|nr:hypothetical protein [Polyangiaceae bacterium]